MTADVLTFPPRLRAAVHDPDAARAAAQFRALDEHLAQQAQAETSLAALNARTLMRGAVAEAVNTMVLVRERMAMIASSIPGTPQGDCAAEGVRMLDASLRRVGEMRRQAMAFEAPEPGGAA